ncbi:MAG TPA: class I SAM-dependent methyltransferase [Casimicrobiaceae bacterium]
MATRVYAGHPGYQLPSRYDIWACPRCDTKFAEPLVADEHVYDLVYRNIEHVRGYARYARYARTVAHLHDPLGYLADEEDSYWAIAEFLGEQPRASDRMLEIGSGLGYLTYAISRRRYNIRGVDISEVAVANARRRFGDLYECGDLRAMAAERAGRYDAVLMTELIEHVPAVEAFVAAALRLVRSGGDVVVTTPNKSPSPAHVLWDTDAPPVHLWWFSETSMRVLAERLGVKVRFIDFAAYNRTHLNEINDGMEMREPTVPPAFDEQGRLIIPPNAFKPVVRKAFFALRLDRIRRAIARHRAGLQPPSSRRKTLCAIFTS